MLCTSAFFGPNSDNDVELEPLQGHFSALRNSFASLVAIRAGNFSSDLTCIKNIQDNIVSAAKLPLLTDLLGTTRKGPVSTPTAQSSGSGGGGFKPPGFRPPSASGTPHGVRESSLQLTITCAEKGATCEEFIANYTLNKDQAEALRRCGDMFTCTDSADPDADTDGSSSSVLLVHGVFGSGKSYFLSVLARFCIALFQFSRAGASAGKLLLSSHTNVAVDRVLDLLLEQDFQDFVRVGSGTVSTRSHKIALNLWCQAIWRPLKICLEPAPSLSLSLSLFFICLSLSPLPPTPSLPLPLSFCFLSRTFLFKI